jgi:hypothetical protein
MIRKHANCKKNQHFIFNNSKKMTQLFLGNILGNFKKLPKIQPSAVIRFIYPKSGRTKTKD